MRNLLPAAAKQSRNLVVAVVLGTAMTAGTSRADTATVTNTEPPPEIIAALTRYCQACWRNARVPADRWADCTQQVFARLLERVETSKWDILLRDETEERKEFVRAIDTVKKQSLRTKTYADLSFDTADKRNTTEHHRYEQWDAITQVAQVVLSQRQQRIVELSASGWGVPEIATELGTTPERVSDEKYKAIRKLRDKLAVDV